MYNSDGYVMIDMSDVDLTRSSQNIPGIYKRVLEVIDTNKLALIVNAGNNTPMAAVVHKKLNYYKITTLLYIFTINTNDIVIVEESGEATVDVEIVPTLTEGTKIADFAIGSIEGELFAPSQQSEINDNVTAVNSTWSSSKINTELSAKADTSDLATVATSGSYTDLSNKPTIPVLTDLIDDTTTAQNTVWSSDKTAAEIAAGAGVTIDDTTTSLTKTWSSDKINTELSDKANSSEVYTKAQLDTAFSAVDTALSAKANSSDVYTKTEVDTALAGKQDVISIHSDNSPTAVSVNGTYQIPANVLAHTFIIIACRRGGYGNSIMFKKEELLTFDNGFTFIGTGVGYYTLKCSNTGLLTVTNITNLSDPYILVTGIL